MLAEVRENIKPASRPKWFLDNVMPYAGALDIIRSASYQSTGDTSINGLLRWLARIDNVDWVPPALVIVSAWQASPDELERGLSALERLASVLMVGRADVDERINRYAGLLELLITGKDIDAACKAMTPSADDLQRARGIVDGNLYLNARVRSYVLLPARRGARREQDAEPAGEPHSGARAARRRRQGASGSPGGRTRRFGRSGLIGSAICSCSPAARTRRRKTSSSS